MTDKKVLVVDDQEEPRESTVEALNDRGYLVLSASGVEKAMRLAGEHNGGLAVVLSDWDMGDGTGLDLLRRFKETYKSTETVFYLMTGIPSEERTRQALELGAEGVITKPFDLHHLRSLVEKHLI